VVASPTLRFAAVLAAADFDTVHVVDVADFASYDTP
jgi:hypothetical protein